MPPATKSGAVDSRPKSPSANASASKPQTPVPARKRRGLFAWFFGGKQPAQPVTIDTSHKTGSADTPSNGEPAKAAPLPPPAAQPVAVPEKRKEKAIDRLEKGYAEVTELVHALREHIDRQSDRSERLLKKMDHLPEALESLPKVSATNSQLLSTMQRHLDQQQEHSERLTQVIDGLVHASKHRDDAIDMLRQQFTAMQDKDTQLMNGFATLGENMGKICDFQQKSASVLDRVMQMGAQAEQRMRDMLDINKRNARTLAMSGWALVVVSVAMTAFVAIAATRLASIPAAAPVTQPVSGQDEAVSDSDQTPVAANTVATPVVPTQLSLESSPQDIAPVNSSSIVSEQVIAPATIDTGTVSAAPTTVEVVEGVEVAPVADLKAAVEGLELDIDWASLADRATRASAWLRPDPTTITTTTSTSTTDNETETPDDEASNDAPPLDAVVDRVAAGESE